MSLHPRAVARRGEHGVGVAGADEASAAVAGGTGWDGAHESGADNAHPGEIRMIH
jgi:hypothetical protein